MDYSSVWRLELAKPMSCWFVKFLSVVFSLCYGPKGQRRHYNANCVSYCTGSGSLALGCVLSLH